MWVRPIRTTRSRLCIYFVFLMAYRNNNKKKLFHYFTMCILFLYLFFRCLCEIGSFERIGNARLTNSPNLIRQRVVGWFGLAVVVAYSFYIINYVGNARRATYKTYAEFHIEGTMVRCVQKDAQPSFYCSYYFDTRWFIFKTLLFHPKLVIVSFEK